MSKPEGGSDMTGKEIGEQVAAQRKEGQVFIKWWRKEEDFLDFDLIDRFVENCGENEEVGGFELVGIDAMWERLQSVVPTRVKLDTLGSQKFVLWKKENGETVECPFAPETLMDIFDAETKDSYID